MAAWRVSTLTGAFFAVLGSYLAVDPSLIGSANFANSEYLVNLLNKMAGREQSFSVQNELTVKLLCCNVTYFPETLSYPTFRILQ